MCQLLNLLHAISPRHLINGGIWDWCLNRRASLLSLNGSILGWNRGDDGLSGYAMNMFPKDCIGGQRDAATRPVWNAMVSEEAVGHLNECVIWCQGWLIPMVGYSCCRHTAVNESAVGHLNECVIWCQGWLIPMVGYSRCRRGNSAVGRLNEYVIWCHGWLIPMVGYSRCRRGNSAVVPVVSFGSAKALGWRGCLRINAEASTLHRIILNVCWCEYCFVNNHAYSVACRYSCDSTSLTTPYINVTSSVISTVARVKCFVFIYRTRHCHFFTSIYMHTYS